MYEMPCDPFLKFDAPEPTNKDIMNQLAYMGKGYGRYEKAYSSLSYLVYEYILRKLGVFEDLDKWPKANYNFAVTYIFIRYNVIPSLLWTLFGTLLGIVFS